MLVRLTIAGVLALALSKLAATSFAGTFNLTFDEYNNLTVSGGVAGSVTGAAGQFDTMGSNAVIYNLAGLGINFGTQRSALILTDSGSGASAKVSDVILFSDQKVYVYNSHSDGSGFAGNYATPQAFQTGIGNMWTPYDASTAGGLAADLVMQNLAIPSGFFNFIVAPEAGGNAQSYAYDSTSAAGLNYVGETQVSTHPTPPNLPAPSFPSTPITVSMTDSSGLFSGHFEDSYQFSPTSPQAGYMFTGSSTSPTNTIGTITFFDPVPLPRAATTGLGLFGCLAAMSALSTLRRRRQEAWVL